ncbi:MAG: LOG family protein [Nitrososphaerales archaeon]
MTTIAVFGSSRRDGHSPLWAEAYQLGRVLATAGYAVLSGGYDGSMAAVSRGASECGGDVIGVTCAIFDPRPCNQWLTQEVKAPTLMARLATMVERADGFVALRGGIGTLSEVTLVWSLLQTRELEGKPLILLGADWRPVVDALKVYTDLGTSIASLAKIVYRPEQVLSALNAPPTPPGPPPLG